MSVIRPIYSVAADGQIRCLGQETDAHRIRAGPDKAARADPRESALRWDNQIGDDAHTNVDTTPAWCITGTPRSPAFCLLP